MKYKHPTLGIEVDTNYVNGTPLYANGPRNPEIYIGVKYDMLKDMGFEQAEEIPEWIEKAYKNYYKMPDEVGCANEKNLLEFANAILYYMPKQEKITYKDLDSIMVGDKTSFYAIRDLLRDKGLLQE